FLLSCVLCSQLQPFLYTTLFRSLQLVQRGQGTPGDGGAAELLATGDRVEPGGRVRVVVLRTVGVELDRLVQRGRAVGVRDEVGGLRARHLDAGAQDDAGQAHAADGGPEQLALRVIRGALRLQVQDAAVGDEQLHGQDVVAEGTRGVA